MDKLPIPIDWAAVNWFEVAVLSLMAFVAAYLGSLLALGSRLFGPILTAFFFGVFFVLWTYWLRDLAGANFAKPV